MAALKGWWARLQRTPVWRAWKRYGDARGNLLAGGVTYFAFFSLFPALALAFTIFGVVLQDIEELLEEIRTYLNGLLPGFIKDGDSGLIPLDAPTGATLSWTGAVGLLGLLWAGLGWLGALRDGIRAIVGAAGEPGNVLTNKLRDLAVLALLGVAIAASALVTMVAGAAVGWVADLVGLGGQSWLLKTVSVLVGVLLDGAIVLVMLRLLSGVAIPWVGLRNGALVGGIGLTVLKLLGTSLLGAMNNPLYASIALVVGLLVWLNFMSRVVLLSSAYAAGWLPEDASVPLTEGVQHKLVEGPVPPPEASRTTRSVSVVDRAAVDQRAEDRANLTLGALAGAGVTAVLAGLMAGRRGLRRRRLR